MGQAPDVVKAVADDVTASWEEDGVVAELGRWFDLEVAATDRADRTSYPA